MDIVIIGTGNVATVLGHAMRQAGHSIVQVYGRNAEKAESLALQLQSKATTQLEEISLHAGLYMIAVADKAISEIANQLRLKDAMVVHTAGSVPLHLLQTISANHGVLYPLQSLRAPHLPTAPVPLMVHANSTENLEMLLRFAKTISPIVQPCNDDNRLHLHLAAVLVNNFTNHLYKLAWDYCQQQGLDFQLLLPIIQETAQRVSAYPPAEVQTGPANRKDVSTMDRHLAMLQDNPDLKAMYQMMSSSIMDSKN
ncbi:MAG TPA: F420-dependent NADP oxidoreductase [Phnomibacter sp.]|nr:F420-dependent NADP oxidoreductase [Phnomibacter sp.]